jgi:hypothetical protein
MAWTPEQRRAWRERNKDREREMKLAYQRGYFLRNSAQIRERARKGYVPSRQRDAVLRSRHGLRPEDWATLWEAQDGRCYLCGGNLLDGKIVIDHDHSCCPAGTSCPACRRGLAHDQCNVAIGYANEDPMRLRRMADALETAQFAVAQRLAKRSEQLPMYDLPD